MADVTCEKCGNVERCPLCGFDQADGNCYVVPEAVCLHQDRLDYRERMARFADAWLAIGLAVRVVREETADESWRHRGKVDYERYEKIARRTVATALAIPAASETTR